MTQIIAIAIITISLDEMPEDGEEGPSGVMGVEVVIVPYDTALLGLYCSLPAYDALT
jgi:hypothetical protein